MKLVLVKISVAAVLAVAPLSGAVAGDDNPANCRAQQSAEIAAQENLDPVDHATKTLDLLGAERNALTTALERMSKDGAGVERKLATLHAEREKITCEMQSLHRLISKGCYPFCLNATKYCNARAAVRRTSTLITLAETIDASIADLDTNLQNGQNEADQIAAAIVRKETQIALVPITTSRIMVTTLPNESAPMLEVLKAMLPEETPEIAAQRVRVAAFLASPLEGESMTAESQSGNTTGVE
jgi:hypothetical protein